MEYSLFGLFLRQQKRFEGIKFYLRKWKSLVAACYLNYGFLYVDGACGLVNKHDALRSKEAALLYGLYLFFCSVFV